VRRDFAAGDEVGLLEVGRARIGDLICFEVVYDGLVRDAVRAGAGMVVVQTNNATFGYSDESEQQLAASRVRAVEFGRTVVVVSTSGISAIVAPDGSLAPPLGSSSPPSSSRTSRSGTPRRLAERLGRAGVAAGPPWASARCWRWPCPGCAGVGLAVERHERAAGAGRRPHLRRGGEPRADPRAAAREPAGRATPWWWTTARPTATGDLAEKLAALDGAVHVLRRTAKSGLGPAYVAGFPVGPRAGYDVLVEMDADGSHRPEQLPALLAALEDADLVLGSATCPAGRVEDWPLHRLLLSRAGNAWTRWSLRLPLADATGGFRAVRGELVDRLPFDDVASQGTASRSTGRGGRSGPAPAWSRCRSPSPSAPSAGAR
jgi:apolipoprotein N-acyltransferase